MDMLDNLKKDLKKNSSKSKAKALQRFFKTGKGEYGEGDVFLGITVPQQRKIAEKYLALDISTLQSLLDSKVHEERLIALLILTDNFKSSNEERRYQILDFYLRNTKNINNWDLVDLSAHHILGNYLLNKPKDILFTLAKSQSLWEKRISIISTFAFIKDNQFDTSLEIAKILLNDSHDLIHKAVGWMLREIGKKDIKIEETFLKMHYKEMPRTMLRYSIEKFPEAKRKAYLNSKI